MWTYRSLQMQMIGRRSNLAGVLAVRSETGPFSECKGPTLLPCRHVLDQLDQALDEALNRQRRRPEVIAITDRVATSRRTVHFVYHDADGLSTPAEPMTRINGVTDPLRDGPRASIITGVDFQCLVSRLLGDDVRERRLAESWRTGK